MAKGSKQQTNKKATPLANNNALAAEERKRTVADDLPVMSPQELKKCISETLKRTASAARGKMPAGLVKAATAIEPAKKELTLQDILDGITFSPEEMAAAEKLKQPIPKLPRDWDEYRFDAEDEAKLSPDARAALKSKRFWRGMRDNPSAQMFNAALANAERLQAERGEHQARIEANEAAEAELQAVRASAGEAAELSVRQQRAVALLVAGKSVHDAAEAIELEASTLERWRREPRFQAELEASVIECRMSIRQRMLKIAERAVTEVEQAIEAHRCPKAALAVLRGVGGMTGETTQTNGAPYVPEVKPGKDAAGRAFASQKEFDDQSATLANAEPGSRNAELKTPAEVKGGAKLNGCESATFVWQRRELRELPESQQYAAFTLESGETLAKAAGVANTTKDEIRSWLRTDQLFQAALVTKFQDKLRQLRGRLLSLAETALDIVDQSVRGGQVQIAIRLLRGMRLL